MLRSSEVVQRYDQAVDDADETLELRARHAGRAARGDALELGLERDPVAVERRERGGDRGGVGNEQRSHRIAVAQRRHHPVEIDDVARDERADLRFGLAVPDLLREVGEPVGAHPQAARIVDRRRAALESPRYEQGRTDRRERHHEREYLDADELCAQSLRTRHALPQR